MKTLFLLLAFAFVSTLSAVADTDKHYEFVLLRDSLGALYAENITVIPGQVPLTLGAETQYIVNVTSFSGDVLHVSPVSFSSEFHSEEFDGEGRLTDIRRNNVSLEKVIVKVPYFKSAQKISIDSKKSRLLEFSVAHFSQVCNDSVCQAHESHQNCPSDCPSGSHDDYCDKAKDGRCDPDCAADSDRDCQQTLAQGSGASNLLIIIIASLTVVILFFTAVRKKFLRNL